MKYKKKLEKLEIRIKDYEKNHTNDPAYTKPGSQTK